MNKAVTDILRNQKGHFETLYVSSVLLFLFFLVFPFFRDYQDENILARNDADIRCIENLVILTDHKQKPKRTCPLSGKSYNVGILDGKRILTCPSPKQHKNTIPKFVKKSDKWFVVQDSPLLNLKEKEQSLTLTEGKLDITHTNDMLFLQIEKTGFLHHIIVVVYLLLLLCFLFNTILILVSGEGFYRLIFFLNLWTAFIAFLFITTSTGVTKIKMPMGEKRMSIERVFMGYELKQHVIENVTYALADDESGAIIMLNYIEKKLSTKVVRIPVKSTSKVVSIINEALYLKQTNYQSPLRQQSSKLF
jgi:hypothetical protein